VAGPALDPTVIAENLRRAEERKARALEEYRAANIELNWWRQGARLFGIGDDVEVGEATDSNEIFPNPILFLDKVTRPTLRQAVVTVMRLEPEALAWSVSDLVLGLQRRGWLPERQDAAKAVSDIAGAMVSDGHLVRLSRGTYALAPELAATFELQASGSRNPHPSGEPGEQG
jgi:hypothetical protein